MLPESALRDVPITDVQNAITSALSSLLPNTRVEVRIVSVDFGSDFTDPVKMSLSIRRGSDVPKKVAS